MDDYADEENTLRLERARILRNARATKRYVDMLFARNQPIPEELRESLYSYRIRLNENSEQLKAIRSNQPIDPEKVVGHIGPETLRQPPADRAEFARLSARPRWRD